MITKEELEFYDDNGFVIIKNFISREKIEKLEDSYNKLRLRLAKSASIDERDYNNEISEIRDLWKLDPNFNKLVLEEEISKAAPLFFKENSCRLLNEHFINKTNGNNGIIPWHQDFTSWPIDDSRGMTFWIPFNDLDENSGVLEVVPKSHLKGEKKPVDFINTKHEFSELETQKLPVQKGDLIVFHCLMWHKSSVNTSVAQRNAYLLDWIPTNSKYAPAHANWHPVNADITVNEGEILNDDCFPIVGKNVCKNQTKKEFIDNSYINDLKNINMFNASKIARNFFIKNLDFQGNIWKYLYNKDNREDANKILTRKYNLNDLEQKELNQLLLSMSINGLAYQDHRGRNIYNKSYLMFKKMFEKDI